MDLPGWCWAEVQLAIIGSSSWLHTGPCNALGAFDGSSMAAFLKRILSASVSCMTLGPTPSAGSEPRLLAARGNTLPCARLQREDYSVDHSVMLPRNIHSARSEALARLRAGNENNIIMV